MNHRWWHRFFIEHLPRDGQRSANLGDWRLGMNQWFVQCRRCTWVGIATLQTEKAELGTKEDA